MSTRDKSFIVLNTIIPSYYNRLKIHNIDLDERFVDGVKRMHLNDPIASGIIMEEEIRKSYYTSCYSSNNVLKYGCTIIMDTINSLWNGSKEFNKKISATNMSKYIPLLPNDMRGEIDMIIEKEDGSFVILEIKVSRMNIRNSNHILQALLYACIMRKNGHRVDEIGVINVMSGHIAVLQLPDRFH